MATVERRVEFKTLKQSVTLEQVMAQICHTTLKRKGKEWVAESCPLCDGKGFSINPEKQTFYCHNNSCKRGGDMIKLVALYHSCSLKEAGVKIAEQFGLLERDDAPATSAQTSVPQPSCEIVVLCLGTDAPPLDQLIQKLFASYSWVDSILCRNGVEVRPQGK